MEIDFDRFDRERKMKFAKFKKRKLITYNFSLCIGHPHPDMYSYSALPQRVIYFIANYGVCSSETLTF